MANGTVEWQWPWGGDLVQLPNGDIATVQDTYGSPDATIQRLEVLVMSIPTLKDDDGNAIGRADDVFNPDYGSGAPALVGESITIDVISSMQSRIEKALKGDPGIAPVPAPVVSIVDGGGGALNVTISGNTTTGQPFTTPAFPLQTLGG